MFLDILTNIGLSEKESKVYLGLLELGTQPASTIAKKADINRTTCYVILNSLIEKGLVTTFNKASIKYFSASEPDNLMKFLKQQKKKLDRYSQELEDNIDNLYQIEQESTSKPKLIVFDGFESSKNIYNDILDAKEIFSIENTANRPEKLSKFLKDDFHKKRIRNKIPLKTLTSDEDNPESTIRAKMEIKETKVIPKKYANFVDTYIYGKKLSLIMYFNESYSGVIIESQMINNVAKNAFNIIWDLSN